MAESAPGPRGPDGRPGGLPPGKATAAPGAASLRSLRDAPDEEGSDSDSETSASSVISSDEEEEEEEEGYQWQVGDACSVTWAGDGQLYPARLLALDRAAGTCLVQFDGYGNAEERALADLLPPRAGPWGQTGTPGSEDPHGTRKSRNRRKGEQAAGSPDPPEVMPPPAPSHTLWEEEEEEDALAAMLMAWYMTGYHTGFYMGLQEGRAEAAESSLRLGRRQKKPTHT